MSLKRLDGQPEPWPISTMAYVANLLNITPGRVRQIARQRSLGQIVAGVRPFRPVDVFAMRNRPGRGRSDRGRLRSPESVPGGAMP